MSTPGATAAEPRIGKPLPEALPRSGFALTEESPKKPNRPRGLAALRDLSGGMVAAWIRPSHHDLGVAHTARGDERE